MGDHLKAIPAQAVSTGRVLYGSRLSVLGSRSLVLVLLLFCTACGLLRIPTPVAWSLTGTPSPTSSNPNFFPPTPAPNEAGAPVGGPGTRVPPATLRATPAPFRPTSQASESTPWLVFSRADGKTLFAVRTGPGSTAGATPIELPDPLLSASDLRAGASPTAGLLAVRTAPGEGPGPRKGMALRLVDLAAGSVSEISPLLSPALEKQWEASSPGQPPAPASAVMDENSLSWSPDGRYLAFIAAADGPSADLYVYDSQRKQSLRLTKGTRQAAAPLWSPNGSWIITQEVDTFGSGTSAGWKVTAVWAASANGSEIHRLYTPPETGGGERVLGWTRPDSLVVATWTPTGIRSVREIPLNTRWLYPIFRGPAATVAFDPTTRWLYFTQDDTSAHAPPDNATPEIPTLPTPTEPAAAPPAATPQGSTPQASTPVVLPTPPRLPGLYRLSPGKGARPELVLAGSWRQVSWQPRMKLFVAQGVQGIFFGSPDGKVQLIKNEGNALFSPNQLWIAGWGDALGGATNGVRLYQPGGALLQQVTRDPVQRLAWTPDSKRGLFPVRVDVVPGQLPQPRAQSRGSGCTGHGDGARFGERAVVQSSVVSFQWMIGIRFGGETNRNETDLEGGRDY